MTDMRRLVIRIPECFYALTQREASESGTSLAGLAREALMARVIFGRMTRGESIYTAAAMTAAALRNLDGDADDLGQMRAEAVATTRATLELAPDLVQQALDRLDQHKPERARHMRKMYGIPDHGTIRDSIFWPATRELTDDLAPKRPPLEEGT